MFLVCKKLTVTGHDDLSTQNNSIKKVTNKWRNYKIIFTYLK